MQRPRTRYATTSAGPDAPNVRIAWQQFGEPGHDIVLLHGFVSHVDAAWDDPDEASFLRALASYARVTTFDKRGVGMSDRNTPPPTLEDRVDEVLAVMDAAGVEQATILAISEGCPLAILFATAHPERVRALALFGAMARTSEAEDYPFAPPREALLESAAELMLPNWDEPVLIEIFNPSRADDPVAIDEWTRRQQISASPSMILQLYAMALDFDVRALLPLITVPTLVMHRRGDRAVPVQGARWMAEQMPTARYVEFEGNDHRPIDGDVEPVLREIEQFVTGTVAVPEPDRVLLTVLFTDLVNSTEQAARDGDAAWSSLLARHHEELAAIVARHRGELRKHLGDGIMATFDGPARAVRAGLAAARAAEALGLVLRAGAHCGEVELMGDDIAGIAVHVAARVGSAAHGGEVWATSTVADLVAGSGLAFEDQGLQSLKGLDRAWHLFSVSDPGASA